MAKIAKPKAKYSWNVFFGSECPFFTITWLFQRHTIWAGPSLYTCPCDVSLKCCRFHNMLPKHTSSKWWMDELHEGIAQQGEHNPILLLKCWFPPMTLLSYVDWELLEKEGYCRKDLSSFLSSPSVYYPVIDRRRKVANQTHVYCISIALQLPLQHFEI